MTFLEYKNRRSAGIADGVPKQVFRNLAFDSASMVVSYFVEVDEQEGGLQWV